MGDLLLVVWPCDGPQPDQGGAPTAKQRTNAPYTRDAVAGSGHRGQGARRGQRILTTPRQAAGGRAWVAHARGRPAASWFADIGSGDVMLDGVAPHAPAAACSFRAGQYRAGQQETYGSWPRRSAVGSMRTGRIASGHLSKHWGVGRRRKGLLPEGADAVIAAAGQLAATLRVARLPTGRSLTLRQ